MATIIDGKKAANEFKELLRDKVAQFEETQSRPPHLTAIIVGEDGASKTYVGAKERACSWVGISSSIVSLPDTTSEADLLKKVYEINRDDHVDGLIVQLPLPDHISDEKIVQAIDPDKDVDGFHWLNMGKMARGDDAFISATPYGITKLLKYYDIPTHGKHAVVVGRSNIVGRPMSILLSEANRETGNATVTLCHRYTENLEHYTRQADILVVAVGIPEFIRKDMVKPGAVVIDVGITRVPADNKKGYVIKGDVAFDEVSEVAGAITPVPGGVGAMTIVGLLENTVKSFERKFKLND
jgi:methylenetetrahydrofolate dehydrogenase (NADP+)/methenyltetrahydrofolate cyclohydrolase